MKPVDGDNACQVEVFVSSEITPRSGRIKHSHSAGVQVGTDTFTGRRLEPLGLRSRKGDSL